MTQSSIARSATEATEQNRGHASDGEVFRIVNVAPNIVYPVVGIAAITHEESASPFRAAMRRHALFAATIAARNPEYRWVAWQDAATRDAELELVTAQVVRCLKQRARTSATIRAELFFENLRAALRTFQLENLPPLRGTELENDGFAIEWIFDNLRLVFAFELTEEDSGWHFVSSRSSGSIRAYGDFSGLALRPLLAWVLESKR